MGYNVDHTRPLEVIDTDKSSATSPYDALALDEESGHCKGGLSMTPASHGETPAHPGEGGKERKRAQRASSQSHEGSSIPSLDQEFASMY